MEHFPPKVKIAPSGISLGWGGKKQSFVKDTILWGFNWAQSEFVAWPRREIFEKTSQRWQWYPHCHWEQLKTDNITQPHAPEKMAHIEGASSPVFPVCTFLSLNLQKHVNPFPRPRGTFLHYGIQCHTSATRWFFSALGLESVWRSPKLPSMLCHVWL